MKQRTRRKLGAHRGTPRQRCPCRDGRGRAHGGKRRRDAQGRQAHAECPEHDERDQLGQPPGCERRRLRAREHLTPVRRSVLRRVTVHRAERRQLRRAHRRDLGGRHGRAEPSGRRRLRLRQ